MENDALASLGQVQTAETRGEGAGSKTTQEGSRRRFGCWRWCLGSALVLGLLLGSGWVYGVRKMNDSGKPSGSLGVVDGSLTSCPDSPNCVSTTARDATHAIDPLVWKGSASEGLDRLELIIQEMPRTGIVERQEHYLRVEFRSWLFRFVDDVEFLVDPEMGVIHFRSASRVGYSDLGVNRKRMEEIRLKFKAAAG